MVHVVREPTLSPWNGIAHLILPTGSVIRLSENVGVFIAKLPCDATTGLIGLSNSPKLVGVDVRNGRYPAAWFVPDANRVVAVIKESSTPEEKAATDRLAAYSDAVFAVIVTIMVLELKAPDQPGLSVLWGVVADSD